jgi:hypothetical protein
MLNFINLHLKNPDSRFLLFLIGIWFLLLIILPWRGYYFLNDDYCYEWNVRNFTERGLDLHPFTGPTMLFQLILGAVIYSFSDDPSLLRLLTSFFFLLGVVFMYKLLLLEKVPPYAAFIATLLLMFNPFYLYLGFTFMAEMYFISTLIISVYFFALAGKSYRSHYLIISMVFLSLSFLSRQEAILAVPAFLLTDLFLLKRRSISHYGFYLIPLLTFLSYQLFAPKTLVFVEGSFFRTLDSLANLQTYTTAVERFVKSIFYVGLFSFPVTLPLLLHFVRSKKIFKLKYLLSFTGAVGVLLFSAAYFWFRSKELMFYIPNVLTYAGFLPASTMMGIKQTIFVNSPVKVQSLITLLSVVSFGGLVLLVVDRFSSLGSIKKVFKEKVSFSVLLFASLFILGTFLVFRSYYDRYLLVLIPPLVIGLGLFIRSYGQKYIKFIAVLSGIFILASVMFEHDYLSLNRTVWEVPEKYGLDKMEYHGSFEFNRYHRLDLIENADSMEMILSKEWLPATEDYSYYISYTQLKDHCIKERVDYKSFISPGSVGSLVLLEEGCFDLP